MKGSRNLLYTPFYRLYQAIICPLNLPIGSPDDSEVSTTKFFSTLKASVEAPKISFPILTKKNPELKVLSFYEKLKKYCIDAILAIGENQKRILQHPDELDDKLINEELYKQYKEKLGETLAELIWGRVPIRMEPFNKASEIINYLAQQILFDLTIKIAFFRILYDRYEQESVEKNSTSAGLSKEFLTNTYEILYKQIDTDLKTVEADMEYISLNKRLDEVGAPMIIAGIFLLFSLVSMYFHLTAEREFNIQDLSIFLILILVAAVSGTILIKFGTHLYESAQSDDISDNYIKMLNAGLSREFKEEVTCLVKIITTSPPPPDQFIGKKWD
jgi:hypothetical protein